MADDRVSDSMSDSDTEGEAMAAILEHCQGNTAKMTAMQSEMQKLAAGQAELKEGQVQLLQLVRSLLNGGGAATAVTPSKPDARYAKLSSGWLYQLPWNPTWCGITHTTTRPFPVPEEGTTQRRQYCAASMVII